LTTESGAAVLDMDTCKWHRFRDVDAAAAF